LYFYSLMGVIAARGAVSLIMFILSLLAARYLTGVNAASEVANLWRVAAACSVMALLVLILRYELTGKDLNLTIELVFTAAFGGVTYVGALFALGVGFKRYFEAG
jgi:hypothetical protein